MIGNSRFPTSFFILVTEQKEILNYQNPTHNMMQACRLRGSGFTGAGLTRLVGYIWRSLSGHQRLVYDAVAEKAREDPYLDVCFRSFDGIQEYKRRLGFPALSDDALELVEHPYLAQVAEAEAAKKAETGEKDSDDDSDSGEETKMN